MKMGRSGYLQPLEPSERSRIAKMGFEARRKNKSKEQFVRFGDTVDIKSIDLDSEEGIRSLENACVKFLGTPQASP